MKIAIIGYATEGKDSAKYYYDQGNEITILDKEASIDVPKHYQSVLGENYLEDLDQYDLIVRSAGINPSVILEANPNVKNKITTNIQEFMKTCPTKNVVGVTGTKGKGTTSTLIYKILKESGLNSHLFGNIGLPPLGQTSKIGPDDWVVLELSSFQLTDFHGPSPHICVCLMMVPEHLNWHKDMQDYIDSKSNLFKHQNEEDYSIYFGDNETSKIVSSPGKGKKVAYFSDQGAYLNDDSIEIEGVKICNTSEVKLLGKHNLENVCAAITAVWQITPDLDAIRSVITTFSGLEHRLEYIRTIDNISFYNDSFATTPETAIAAIKSFDSPKVLILGGSDKGVSLEPLVEEVLANNVRHVVAIGDMGPYIAKQLLASGFNNITEGLKSMEDIVQSAYTSAISGDVVLLSTGCASFGLFKDYKDRGKQFKKAVLKLP